MHTKSESLQQINTHTLTYTHTSPSKKTPLPSQRPFIGLSPTKGYHTYCTIHTNHISADLIERTIRVIPKRIPTVLVDTITILALASEMNY